VEKANGGNMSLYLIDVERLKKREQTGLDTLVASSLNTGCEKRYELLFIW